MSSVIAAFLPSSATGEFAHVLLSRLRERLTSFLQSHRTTLMGYILGSLLSFFFVPNSNADFGVLLALYPLPDWLLPGPVWAANGGCCVALNSADFGRNIAIYIIYC